MARGKLTKQAIDSFDVTDRVQFLWDSDLKGFGLKLTPSGAKSYVFQYRLGGRESPTRRWTIGGHGSPWTPAMARTEAERLAIMVAQGVDPAAAEAERRRRAVDLALDKYSAKFASQCAGNGWRALVDRTFRLHVTPALKSRSIDTITRSDISLVLDRLPIEKAALRRNTFAVLRRMFRWAVERGDIERSPIDGMEAPPAVEPRDRVLADAELRAIWSSSFQAGRLFGPIVRLLMLTGQRREEVSRMSWSELDRTAETWTLPKERAKNGITHIVPLTPEMIIELDGIVANRRWPTSGFVFKTSGGKPYSAFAKGKARIDRLIAQTELLEKQWRLHDLRRTMATGFQKLGIRFEVTESALNHVSGSRSGIAGIYQRHDWLVEKRAAFLAWTAHLHEAVIRKPNACGGS